MRCPDCSQRNSVAAKKCAACGISLRRKPLPIGLKIFLGILVSLAFIFWLTNFSSAINNPERVLTNTASNLTTKSKSAEQMMGNIKYFDQAVKEFLKKYGSLGSIELANKLSICLPKSLYENHIFEILPNLKLVEIDTALNAANYLILLSNGQTEVLPVKGLDVYDSNSFLPQNSKSDIDKKANEGQLLVLLGHATGVNGHKPRVKIILLSSTLQSDSVVDLTDKVVPELNGEGTAKFSPNQKDIELSISLYSRGQDLNVFSKDQSKASLPIDNEYLYEQLIWQNNAYILRAQPGISKLSALFAAGSALKNHNKLPYFSSYLSNNARRTIDQTPPVKSDQGFVISSYKGTGKRQTGYNIYILKNDSVKALVELRPLATGKKGNNVTWLVNSISVSKVAPVVTEDKTTLPDPKAEDKSKIQERDKAAEQAKAKEKAKIEDKVKIAAEEKARLASVAITPPAPSSQTSIDKSTTQPIDEGGPANFVKGLAANIKLRSGPGINFDSTYEISPTKRINIIGKDNGWYKVRVDDKEGFIYAGFVKNQKNSVYRNAVTKQGSNVRDEQRHIITNVKAGEYLVILGTQKNRYKVILSNGKVGYITREAIDGTAVDSPPPSVP